MSEFKVTTIETVIAANCCSMILLRPGEFSFINKTHVLYRIGYAQEREMSPLSIVVDTHLCISVES